MIFVSVNVIWAVNYGHFHPRNKFGEIQVILNESRANLFHLCEYSDLIQHYESTAELK